MSSPPVTPALPLLPVAPLDGESGYLRWKESVMLRLHTLGLAHVLSEEEGTSSGKQRVRDDALCRGHILATLSDRLLPAYAHHATAGAVWHAVARTYDLDIGRAASWTKAGEFRYDAGKPLLEQLALLQALATFAGRGTSDDMVCFIKTSGFPWEMVLKIDKHSPAPPVDQIWEIARKQEMLHRIRETARQWSHSSDDSRPLKRGTR